MSHFPQRCLLTGCVGMREKLVLFNILLQYRDEFVDVLSEISDNVQWPPWWYNRSKTPFQTAPWQRTARPLGTVWWWSETKRGREIEMVKIDKTIEQKVIVKPPQTKWAAPDFLAPKKDGLLRFLVDNRRLNALTWQELYPTPRIIRCFNWLGRATVFPMLDVDSGYWQVGSKEKVRGKAALNSQHEITDLSVCHLDSEMLLAYFKEQWMSISLR